MPSLNDILIGDIFGFLLALPLSLFMAFWLSAVKKRAAVVFGALLGALIAFVGICSGPTHCPARMVVLRSSDRFSFVQRRPSSAASSQIYWLLA
jgi:hypothetical protein